MLSKCSSATMLVALFFAAGVGHAASTNAKRVCPVTSKNSVKQIEIFDGRPEDLAYLAPDDDKAAPNTYTVGGIYDRGDIVVVRCKYSSGKVLDVSLKNRVDVCTFKTGKKSSAALFCK